MEPFTALAAAIVVPLNLVIYVKTQSRVSKKLIILVTLTSIATNLSGINIKMFLTIFIKLQLNKNKIY